MLRTEILRNSPQAQKTMDIHTYTVQGASTYEEVRCAQTIEPNAARNAGTLLSIRLDDLGIDEVPKYCMILNVLLKDTQYYETTLVVFFMLASVELFLQNPSQ